MSALVDLQSIIILNVKERLKSKTSVDMGMFFKLGAVICECEGIIVSVYLSVTYYLRVFHRLTIKRAVIDRIAEFQ